MKRLFIIVLSISSILLLSGCKSDVEKAVSAYKSVTIDITINKNVGAEITSLKQEYMFTNKMYYIKTTDSNGKILFYEGDLEENSQNCYRYSYNNDSNTYSLITKHTCVSKLIDDFFYSYTSIDTNQLSYSESGDYYSSSGNYLSEYASSNIYNKEVFLREPRFYLDGSKLDKITYTQLDDTNDFDTYLYELKFSKHNNTDISR